MSLVAYAVRTTLWRALLGKTYAQERVYDSQVAPIDELVRDQPALFIIVATDDETSDVSGHDYIGASRDLDVVIEIALAIELRRVGGSFGVSISEIDPAVIERLRNRFEAATKAIDDCDRASRMGPGRRPSLLVYRVVCVDEDTTLWSMSDIGNLRAALNALTRVFGC